MLEKCRRLVYSRVLSARSFYRIVVDKRFEELYEQLSEVDRQDVFVAISNGDINLFKMLLSRLRKNDLDLMSMRDLRLLGQKHNIQGYNNMVKFKLVELIKERINEKNAAIRDARNNAGTSIGGGHQKEETPGVGESLPTPE